MKSPHAWFCDSCGQSWETCNQETRRQQSRSRQTYADGSQHGADPPWNASGWPAQQNYGTGQSPRKKSRRRQNRNQQQGHQGGQDLGKGVGKSGGKHKGKPLALQPAAPLPPPAGPPPSTSWASTNAPWLSVPPAPPAVEVATPGETSAEQTLRLLAQQIQQNPDSATPEVLAIVQRHKIQGKKQYTKELHTAVKDLGQARQALDEAVNARSQLLARWRTFLDASLKQWKEYTDMFQAQEKSCQEQIALARDSVNKAKDEFAAKQSGDTHEISDDDGDFQEQASKESSSRILGGMQHMTSGLQQLSVQAEQAFQEEEARKLKRPRRAEEAADDVMATAPPQPEDAAPSQPAAPGTKAMQPFALPGQ